MDAKPRVLLLSDSPYFGGISSHLMSVLRAMRGSRFDVRLATLPGRRGDNWLIEACRRDGIPIHEFSMLHAFDAGVLGQLRRYVRENGIRLVHTHNYRATLVARLARLPVPVINTCHGQMAEASVRLKAWQWAELRAMRGHRLTIACSDYVRGWLESNGIGHSRTIRNCYQPPAEVEPLTRAELDVPAGDLLVLYAGRLCDGKGIEFLVEAAAGTRGATVLVAGDGPLRADLERQAKRLSAPTRFLGQIEQPAALYGVADVVVLPSRMEALPMTLIEAAAHGRASVATRVGGVPEVVEEGGSGLLVEYGDAAALRAALDRMKDGHARERMGLRARQVWEERFTLERFARELSAAYSDALGS